MTSKIITLALAGATHAEIEAATGSNDGTIRSVLSRARKRGVPIPLGRRGRPATGGVDYRSLACPVCDSQRLRVAHVTHNGGTIRRKRRCVGCGYRFFTREDWCDENGKVVDHG